MKSHLTAKTTPKTRRLKGAIPSRGLALKALANEIRAALAKMLTGTCSKIGSGKRSRIAIRREVAETDHPSVAAVEIVADAAVETVVAAADAAAAGIAVDGTNGRAQRDRHVRKSVRVATNLVLPTQHPRLIEVNPVIQPLGHDVTTARAMIVARELNADQIVTRAVTNHGQPLRVNWRLQQTFPMISVPASLKNNRRRHGHPLFRNRQLRPLVRHARRRSHKARTPLMRCCGIRIV